MINKLVLTCLAVFSLSTLQAQTSEKVVPDQAVTSQGGLRGGVRIQKTQKLYWENGIALDYNNSNLLSSRIHYGISYVTTRVGSAIGSNAIKQDNFLVNLGYHFRNQKKLQPFTRLNMGYFHAAYDAPMFEVLPNNAFLISLDAGLSYEFKLPITVNLSTGYNFNNGSGVSGPGTLFPVFYQMGILYTIFKK